MIYLLYKLLTAPLKRDILAGSWVKHPSHNDSPVSDATDRWGVLRLGFIVQAEQHSVFCLQHLSLFPHLT